MVNVEQRLDEADGRGVPWRRWGPYLSERQWGAVCEDYSGGADAWSSFTHDQARFRAYRWGEDRLAGFSDDRQLLCLALSLWNGRDPILKERLFGLTNAEGNHGEDVKECFTGTFLKDTDGRRPVHGEQPVLQADPYWRDLLLFYEYFHGDNGAGIGAIHQTGWTGTVGLLTLLFRGASAERLRARIRGVSRTPRPQRTAAAQ
ncbi:MAG TPA: hypothetical protein VII22_00980 [Streptosporangiaceae bacterium]